MQSTVETGFLRVWLDVRGFQRYAEGRAVYKRVRYKCSSVRMIGVQTEAFVVRNLLRVKAPGRHSVYITAKAIYGSFHFLTPTLVDFSVCCPGGTTSVQTSGFHNVVRGSLGFRDQFPGDSWIHFCNGCLEV
jgi:hypothetical protein